MALLSRTRVAIWSSGRALLAYRINSRVSSYPPHYRLEPILSSNILESSNNLFVRNSCSVSEMVDVDPDISILFAAEKGLIPKQNVKICASLKHNRKAIPDIKLASRLDQTWEERLLENPRIWNATKFRVAGVEADNKRSLTFYLGITCYKDFLSTNWAPYARELSRLGVVTAGSSQAYLSDAMGVGALVISRDRKVILMKRSDHVAEAAGWWDVPGGHSEPEMLVGKKRMEDIRPDDLNEADVVHEIFDSIVREITDEVNIPAEALTEPEIMGVAANNHSAGRPSVEFLVRSSMSSEEICRRYHLGSQAEADESTSILLLDLEDVLRLHDSPVWARLAPSAKGCFHLYHLTRHAAQ